MAIVDRAAAQVAQQLAAAARSPDPWQRLEQACAAHLAALLKGEGALRVLATEIPSRRTGMVHTALVRTRDADEDVFRRAGGRAAGARPGVDRSYLRLTLLVRSTGRSSGTARRRLPGTIARQIVTLIRHGAQE